MPAVRYRRKRLGAHLVIGLAGGGLCEDVIRLLYEVVLLLRYHALLLRLTHQLVRVQRQAGLPIGILERRGGRKVVCDAELFVVVDKLVELAHLGAIEVDGVRTERGVAPPPLVEHPADVLRLLGERRRHLCSSVLGDLERRGTDLVGLVDLLGRHLVTQLRK